ncbi:NADH-quinone oxidoreductase subunit A [Buchnera aphidicola (Mollitrichosiphum nigrofasciatum)]|uniref:NADH-quinone oxidoreductase subunit A n=1 Tax=Buchnera aphidicola TaxID=9 RepID=UPI0031B89E3A
MLKNFNEIIEFFGFLSSLICLLFIVCIMLIGGFFLGNRSVSSIKHIPFESGIVAFGNTNLRLSINFYLIAVCFVIFDVETPYLYSWICNINSNGWLGMFFVFNFIITLLISLFYLIRVGILKFCV